MDFKTWLSPHYAAATAYRNRLHWTYETVKLYCHGAVCEQKHIDLAIQLLRDIPMPAPHGKYAGEVTEADKEWYREEGRIDNAGRLNEYIEMVKKLKPLPRG